MSKKFLKLITTSLILLISTTSCKNTAFDDNYQIKWMDENVKFLKHKNFGRNHKPDSEWLMESDPQAGCILRAMGPWKKQTLETGGPTYGSVYWSRHQTWAELHAGGWVTEEYTTLDDPDDNSAKIAKRIASGEIRDKFIYIGPWQYVSKIGKEIRFVATQDPLYGGLGGFFESKDSQNVKIPEMPEIQLARSPEMNLDYCKVLWIKTYGYNAVIDLQLNYPIGIFTGKIMKGSGEIIQADE